MRACVRACVRVCVQAGSAFGDHYVVIAKLKLQIYIFKPIKTLSRKRIIQFDL